MNELMYNFKENNVSHDLSRIKKKNKGVVTNDTHERKQNVLTLSESKAWY